MRLKDLGTNDMDVTAARDMHESIVAHLMRGPSDSEGAMHRAESMFGLAYWSQWNLRHKRRATAAFMDRVREAYLSVLQSSVRRDLEKLRIEAAKNGERALSDVQDLIVEAEDLLAKLEARKC